MQRRSGFRRLREGFGRLIEALSFPNLTLMRVDTDQRGARPLETQKARSGLINALSPLSRRLGVIRKAAKIAPQAGNPSCCIAPKGRI
jgi:hypothetical protein